MEKVNSQFEQPSQQKELVDYRVAGIAKKAAGLLLQEAITDMCNTMRNDPWWSDFRVDEKGENMARLARKHIKKIHASISRWEQAKLYYEEVNK